jgi:hypothetical protein
MDQDRSLSGPLSEGYSIVVKTPIGSGTNKSHLPLG